MRRLLVLLLLVAATACGGPSTDDATGGDRATDIAFVTELMHRDAALLNLLDVGLGRPMDPALTAATEQLRRDAIARIEKASDQLESWDQKVPKTVRDHAFAHSSDGHDIPSLDGMPTGDDLQVLGRVPRPGFEAAFANLLTSTLEAIRDAAAGHPAGTRAVGALARDAERSSETALRSM